MKNSQTNIQHKYHNFKKYFTKNKIPNLNFPKAALMVKQAEEGKSQEFELFPLLLLTYIFILYTKDHINEKRKII